jgi:hypothetical protein
MPPCQTNDPEHWRNRAAQMRTLASTMPGEAAILMNDLADEYDRLAERAVTRAKWQKAAIEWRVALSVGRRSDRRSEKRPRLGSRGHRKQGHH